MNLLSLFTLLFSPHRTHISMTHSLTHPPVSNTGWGFLGLTVARFAVQVERWSELLEPAKNDAGAAFWLQPAGSGQFYLCMRVCVSLFSLPTCGAREFTLRRDILASCMPVTRKTRGGGEKMGFPSSHGNHDMKDRSCQDP